jgi:hypothetical protein
MKAFVVDLSRCTGCYCRCTHCDEAPCKQACLVEGAICQREESCPYDALYFDGALNIAQKAAKEYDPSSGLRFNAWLETKQ